MRAIIALAAFGMLMTACGTESTDQSTSIPPPDATSAPTTVAPVPTGPPTAPASTTPDDPAEAEIVEAAVADLAERLEVDPEEISPVSFEWVTWNDGSIGCPEPGVVYTQALVEGSLTVLEHDGLEYDYHAGAGGNPFLCEKSRLEPGPGASTTIPDS
jgi:hypothetical protein